MPAGPTKEKKSAAERSEGIFLQSGIADGMTSAGLLGMLNPTLASALQQSSIQSLTSNSSSDNSSLSDAAGNGTTLAGIANVEKQPEMNATLNLPELLSGFGTNATVQQASSDLHIQLGSNNDFENALKQVMHVAQLTQTNESRLPMRVALEIQTPPGAIVNVYVSRQNDQWRAQLSTDDPQALSWVQDKMSSLSQSTDLGISVRWLPPQMESGPSSAETGSSWDREGQNQGQAGYQQQPDERQQPQRQKQAPLLPPLSTLKNNPFVKTLNALGRAA
jgi:hypothetical protein